MGVQLRMKVKLLEITLKSKTLTYFQIHRKAHSDAIVYVRALAKRSLKSFPEHFEEDENVWKKKQRIQAAKCWAVLFHLDDENEDDDAEDDEDSQDGNKDE